MEESGDRKSGRIIGLTGMYCAGKNYIAALLEARGIPVLDVDKLGHEALNLEKDAVIERFGPAVLGDDGAVDRRHLGSLVFGKREALAALEGIVHPAANRLTAEWIAAQGGGACVINAALLHRSSAFDHLDGIILVKAAWIIRLIRARKRDKLPWTQLLRRFNSQKKFITQYFKKETDRYIVYNNGISLFRNGPERRIEQVISRLGVK
jgi:dephospho-CoA kinase